MLMALLAPLVKATLRLDDFETGLLLGAFFVLAYAASSFALRAVADRHNRVRLVAAGMVLSSLAVLGCGVAPGFAGLALARAGLGISQSLLSPAALSLIAQVLPRAKLSRGVAFYTSGATLGRSLALGIGGAVLAGVQALLAARHGTLVAWRLVFIVFAVPNLLLAALVARIPEPARPPRSPDAGRSDAGLWAWISYHKSFFLTHALTASAVVLVIQTVTAWTTTLLTRRFHVPVSLAGETFGVVVLVTAPLGHWLGGALLGRLDRRLGLRAPGAVMATALATAVPLTALLGLAPDYAVALVGLGLLSLTMGIAAPAGFTAIQLIAPEHLRGQATALFLVCVTLIGFGLGPPALGLLTDHLFGAAGIGKALLLVVTTSAVLGVMGAVLQRREKVL